MEQMSRLVLGRLAQGKRVEMRQKCTIIVILCVNKGLGLGI